MSKCWNCGIEIGDSHYVCPLCKCIVERDEKENSDKLYPYPNAEKGIRKAQCAMRIYLLAAILLEVLLAGIDYRANGRWGWVILIGAFLVYGYFILRILLEMSAAYRLKMVLLTFLGVGVVLAIYIETGLSGWARNYDLPDAFALQDFLIILLMIVSRREWQSYIPLQILIIALCFIPLILYYLGLVTTLTGGVISLAASILFFAGTMIVGGNRARSELYRRFHV